MSETDPKQIHELLDSVYRAESGRILATLIRLLGDFDLAEDAVHDAFAAALERWPKAGVPAKHPGVKAGPFEIRPAADLSAMIRDSEKRRAKAK